MAFDKKDFGFITDIKIRHNGNVDKAYFAWSNMIKRCYNKNNPRYKDYGNKGIFISDEFKLFSNFKKWYDENNPNGDLVMDKDILGKGYYGVDSVLFITNKENIKEANKRRVYAKGINHANAKKKDDYKTSPSLRGHFKRACITHGWDFDNFKEIFHSKKEKGRSKYIYFEKI